MAIESKVIAGKDIWYVDSHQEVLLPWSKYRRRVDEAPLLITFDYHTDLWEPFQSSTESGGLRDKLVEEINFDDDSSVRKAVDNLGNDEHITTAIRGNIISKAYVVARDGDKYKNKCSQYSRCNKEPQYKFCMEHQCDNQDIFVPDWKQLNNNRECEVITDDFLVKIFDEIKKRDNFNISKDFLKNTKYILDIDMDYFTCPDNFTNQNCDFFYSLIRNANIITIAIEENYVNSLSKDCLKIDEIRIFLEESITNAVMN